MKSIKSILVAVVKELNKQNIGYYATGGTALYLRGIIDDTQDVDLFVNFKDLKKLREIYSKFIIPSEHKVKNYLNLRIEGREIEFIGVNSTWDKQSYVQLKNRDYDIIKLNKTHVNISTLKNLITCYEFAYNQFGKEKHLMRIELIKNYLYKHKKA
ncbi:MAG: hypothetical protein WCX82_00315 [archaeon]|jgi:hypothetical protein